MFVREYLFNGDDDSSLYRVSHLPDIFPRFGISYHLSANRPSQSLSSPSQSLSPTLNPLAPLSAPLHSSPLRPVRFTPPRRSASPLTPPAALLANWKVWPVIQAVNFSLMPLPYRVPFQSTCGIGWVLYLSLLNARCVCVWRRRGIAAGLAFRSTFTLFSLPVVSLG